MVRTVLVSVMAYTALVLFLRISGKRTLSKLNAFDFVVTVALGSTLATILLSKNVALAEGLTALAMLIGLQYAVTWTAVRSSTFSGLIRSEPTLLARDGRLLESAMHRQRITEGEIMSAVRDRGAQRLEEVEAVFLESDGSITALLRRG
ncbi:MAG: DUF421 domain-containing protein [Pseudomonadota bacterium]|nr:DUF421 domain-containing protein [Pseudomonadota bacterium]